MQYVISNLKWCDRMKRSRLHLADAAISIVLKFRTPKWTTILLLKNATVRMLNEYFVLLKNINIAYKNMWRNAYEIRAKTTAFFALDMPK